MDNIKLGIITALQQRYGTADYSRFNVQRWVYYDRIRYPAAGATQLSFFSVQIGGADPTSNAIKTSEQTNMPKSRTFGELAFMLHAIRCVATIAPKPRQPTALNTDTTLLASTITGMMPKFKELLRRGTLNIKFIDKDYIQINQPFLKAPPGFGTNIEQIAGNYVAAGGGVQNYQIWVQQYPKADGIFGVSPFYFIEPQTTITCTIDYPTTSPVFSGLVDSGDPSIDVGVFLDGYLIRPVA